MAADLSPLERSSNRASSLTPKSLLQAKMDWEHQSAAQWPKEPNSNRQVELAHGYFFDCKRGFHKLEENHLSLWIEEGKRSEESLLEINLKKLAVGILLLAKLYNYRKRHLIETNLLTIKTSSLKLKLTSHHQLSPCAYACSSKPNTQLTHTIKNNLYDLRLENYIYVEDLIDLGETLN